MKRLKRKVPTSLAFGIIALVIVVLGVWMYALQSDYDQPVALLPNEQSSTTTSTSHAAGASATIDASSLVSHSGNPTIRGSASGVSEVHVAIGGPTLPSGFRTNPCWIPVVNGRWSITLPTNQILQNGTYQVNVLGNNAHYDCSVQATASNSMTLAHGTLIVK